jgi:hypothetical protein
MRYKDYDESLSSKEFLEPYDKINVFINLETVFKHLSMIPDLEKKLVLQRDFDIILVSNILNLAAHYKRFFIINGLDTKVYLYHTDFDSDNFNQYKYNEDYRTYYLVKYNDNPKFVYLTEALKASILPEIRTYCEFIPNLYYISAKNIEGSLVPLVIANENKVRKNLIIGGEYYDTQYSFIPKFVNHFIHKGPGYNSVTSSPKEYLKEITKKSDDDIKAMTNIYNSHSTYCSLISVLGDRSRSIDGLSGIGPKILQKYIESGLQRNEIQLTTTNPEMIGSIFHDEDMKEEFINNYYCTSLLDMYDELTSSEKLSITNQRRDRYDMNSLISLNNTRFYNHPLILESLSL